jgi:spermidine synthase
MIPWEELDRAQIPEGEGELILRKRGAEYSIRTANTELMNSRLHGSEAALGEVACKRLRHHSDLNILIGGLGMGYTLAAALENSSPNSRLTVSELVPAVIRWNVEYFGHLAGFPLNDPRVSVQPGDVVKPIMSRKAAWNAILLDVDNGPEGLTREANNQLYGMPGLRASFAALSPGGIFAVWSYAPDIGFTRRLKKCRFQTEVVTVRARKSGKGRNHTIWLAAKPG